MGRCPSLRTGEYGQISPVQKIKITRQSIPENLILTKIAAQSQYSLCFSTSFPVTGPYSLCSGISGKPMGYKQSVPGPRGQEQPARHLDLAPGLMTSRSFCQEFFKAGNRSPGALNINKYLVELVSSLLFKGQFTSWIIITVVCSPETRIIQALQLRVGAKGKKKPKDHLVIDPLCAVFPCSQPVSGWMKQKLYCCACPHLIHVVFHCRPVFSFL